MPALVPVPWQPHLFLTPDTLALLVAAGEKRGKPLHIVGNDGAWREYAKQKYYYDGWVARKPGFNVASNPDTGQRSHMRGAAFDLINTDAATQAACRAVGLIRDPSEPWHWNNPRWASMPIIKTNTATAGTPSTPITIPQSNGDETMYMTDSTNGTVYLVTDANGFYALTDPAHIGLLTRLGVVRKDRFNPVEIAQMHAVIIANRPAPTTSTGGTTAIDYDLIAQRVADKLAARLVS